MEKTDKEIKTNEKKEELPKPLPKPSRPINHVYKFSDLLIVPEIIDKYVKPFKQKIEINHEIPEFYFRLEDLSYNELFDLFREDLDKFLDNFREALFQNLENDPFVGEILKGENLESKELHIILDSNNNFKFLTLELKNFSENWSKYTNKLIKIQVSYMTINLDDKDKPYHKSITYYCSDHMNKFDKVYPYGIIMDSFVKPIGCFNKKCKNKNLVPVKYNSYEVGSFNIGELDFKETRQYRRCWIFRNIDYFLKKIENIDIGEEVEILGIIRLNATKLGKRADRPEYYIDVMDLNPIKTKKIDEGIIEIIKQKINKDPSYIEKLIDSVHPITFQMENFYPSKHFCGCSIITGGSWVSVPSKKDSLDLLLGGAKGTMKSSIEKEYVRKMGNIYRIEVPKQGFTHAGLFGTTDRNARDGTPEVIYGPLTLHSDTTVILDEFQNTPINIREDVIRHKEAGFYPIVQDKTSINCNYKASLILSQNFIGPKGSYDHSESKDLFDNLFWPKKTNEESLLDRIDLFLKVPRKDTFTQNKILRNITYMDDVLEKVSLVLELDDFIFPENIKTIQEKLDYIHFNYFNKCKLTYRKAKLGRFEELLLGFFETMVRESSKQNMFDNDAFEARTLGTCGRLLRVFASLRLDECVNDSDYEMFNHSTQYILAFRDCEFIEKMNIDLTKSFREMFDHEIIGYDINKIDIREIFDRMKAYLQRNYFNNLIPEKREQELNFYLGIERNMSNNNLKKLLNNNELWLESKGYKIIPAGKGRGHITSIERELEIEKQVDEKRTCSKGDLANFLDHSEFKDYESSQKVLEVFDSLKEIYEENDYGKINKNSLIQGLEINAGPISTTKLESVLNYFLNLGVLIESGKDLCTLAKKWT